MQRKNGKMEKKGKEGDSADEILNTNGTAKFLGLTVSYVGRLFRSGKLPGKRLNGRAWFTTKGVAQKFKNEYQGYMKGRGRPSVGEMAKRAREADRQQKPRREAE